MKSIKKTTALFASCIMAASSVLLCPSEELDRAGARGMMMSAIQAEMADRSFTVENGEQITIDDLISHGLNVKAISGSLPDMYEDAYLYSGYIFPGGGYYSMDVTGKTVIVSPDVLKNGKNTFVLSYTSYGSEFGSELLTTVEADVTINNYSEDDSAEDETYRVINGDMNGDDLTDVTDLSLLSILLADRTESVKGEDGMFTGDIDGNGKVELCDLALYRQHIVKLAREVTDRGCLTKNNKKIYCWDVDREGKMCIYPTSEYKFPEKDWNECRSQIRNIEVKKGVSEIECLSSLPCLETVNLSDTVEVLGEKALSNCPSLTSIENAGKVNKVDSMALYNTPFLDNNDEEFMVLGDVLFRYRGSSETVEIPEGIKRIGVLAFYGNEALKSVVIPDSVTEIDVNAFSDCANLESVKLPSGIETLNAGLFSDCSSLKEIEIPESVSQINEHVFARTAITDLVFPEKITILGSYSLYDCGELKTVTFKSGDGIICDDAFYHCQGFEYPEVIGGTVDIPEEN